MRDSSRALPWKGVPYFNVNATISSEVIARRFFAIALLQAHCIRPIDILYVVTYSHTEIL